MPKRNLRLNELSDLLTRKKCTRNFHAGFADPPLKMNLVTRIPWIVHWMGEGIIGCMGIGLVMIVLSLLRKGFIVQFVFWDIMRTRMNALLCAIIVSFGSMGFVKNFEEQVLAHEGRAFMCTRCRL